MEPSKKFALVLYPITPYVDAEIHRRPWLVRRTPALRRTFNRIIEKRFRARGHTITWAFFATDGDERTPDLGLRSPFFDIRPEDRIITAPVPFARHCAERVYPPPCALLDPLGAIARLAVCGFHLSDCVDRVARAAHRRGIPTKVHEELTEHFFYEGVHRRVGAHPRPLLARTMPVDPVINSRESLRSLVEHERRDRHRKPWLMQWT